MIKHGFIYFISRIITGAVAFLSIILYTRMMIPEEYGRYALVLVYVNLINATLYQCLRLGLIRFIPKYTNNVAQYKNLLSTVFACFSICCAITLVVCLLLNWLTNQSLAYFAAFLFYLWTTAWFELSQAIQRSNLKPVRFGFMICIKSFLSLLFGLGALKLGFGEIGLITGIATGTLISNIIYIRDWSIRFALSIDKDLMKELLKYGAPLIISGGMTYVMQSVDRIMISQILGESEAGIYSVTFDFTMQTIGMLMLIVNLSALPLVIRKLEQDGPNSAREQLSQNYALLLGIALPATIGFTVLAPNIVGIVFGEEYRTLSTLILPIISFAMFFQGMKSYYTDTSFQLGKTSYKQVIPVAIGIALNVTLNLVLIPRFGLVGASIASVTSYFVSLTVNWYITGKVFPLPLPVKDTIKIVASTLAMMLILLALRQFNGIIFLIIQIGSGAIIYTGMIFALNVMNSRTILLNRVLKIKKAEVAGSNQ